ncbi:MAG TPA: pentapeptide repeat-containing protein [Phycisphaerae bacterium]|nr:pentapeptide repeat-containing protein [Phycisphaerae bacterium]
MADKPEISRSPGAPRVLIRPHVRAEPGGDPLPLDAYVGDFLERGRPALINLYGPPGSGKSSALRWLAARFPDAPLDVFDEPAGDALIVVDPPHVRIHASEAADWRIVLPYQMASWTEDDLIAYLLANHRDRCASVMTRLRACRDLFSLDGLPSVCVLVCDAFAADESLTDIPTAIRRRIAESVQGSWTYERLASQAFEAMQRTEARGFYDTFLRGVLGHTFVRSLIAAEHFVTALVSGDQTVLQRSVAPVVVRDIAVLLRTRRDVVERLESLVMHPAYQANIVSMLVAADPAWTPGGRKLTSLRRIAIPQLQWTKVDLSDLDAAEANFAHGDFRHALLKGANLAGATLSHVNFDHAILSGACLEKANLSGTCFHNASLVGASLEAALLEGASFAGADLTGCKGANCDWRGANLDAAILAGAGLRRCNFEAMAIGEPCFMGAELKGALFTGSEIGGGDFSDANLRNAGLADIRWPEADLRGADLRGASFHLGSSRSGLVGSVIASEGTRTGFYTDDYLDLDHKPPEEIRKANLCGADLRGAVVEETDFYLVDLRGAKYTEDQGRHFANCGAILRSRTAR